MRISDWSSDVCSSDLSITTSSTSLSASHSPRSRTPFAVVENVALSTCTAVPSNSSTHATTESRSTTRTPTRSRLLHTAHTTFTPRYRPEGTRSTTEHESWAHRHHATHNGNRPN